MVKHAIAQPEVEVEIRTLCIDIGGTGLKVLVADAKGVPLTERVRVETPKPATPQAVLGQLVVMIGQIGDFDRVSVGFPGVVEDGVTRTAPNLGEAWRDFPLAETLNREFGKPVRALNDAGVQGHGVIEGQGTELVLTLGTGMGFALFVGGRYVPNLEMAHHPFRNKKSYEQTIGNVALEKVGKKRWNKRVHKVLAQLQPIFNPRCIYLGGGNAKHLKGELPSNVKITDNLAGLFGGVALWNY